MCAESVGVVSFTVVESFSGFVSTILAPIFCTVTKTLTVKTEVTKRIAKRKIVRAKSSSVNLDVAFRCRGCGTLDIFIDHKLSVA